MRLERGEGFVRKAEHLPAEDLGQTGALELVQYRTFDLGQVQQLVASHQAFVERKQTLERSGIDVIDG